MTFLHGMRRLASKVGVDVQRRTPMTMPFLRLVETLRQRGVRTVIDVGANNGGYAADLLEAGFDGHVVSFEPLPAEWRALRDRASKWNGRWTVGDCVALSDRHGEASFHVASNSVSSSLLSMGPRHEAAAPASAIRNVITVRTERLDDIVGTMDLQGPVFLKIDVQGAEHLVLAGAAESLKGPIVGIQLELSLAQLYEGQISAGGIHSALAGLGFKLWDMIPGFRDPQSFELLQYDGIFYRA